MNSRVLAWIFGTIAVVSIAGNIFQNLKYSPNRALVKIGPETITKSNYLGAVEYQAGKAVLTKMVYERLIQQAAKAANVEATDKDVDQRIEEIKRRQPKQLEAAQFNPVLMGEFKQNLKTNLSMENLQIKDVKVTDAEVVDFYNKHKDAFILPQQMQAQIVVAQSATDAETAKHLLEQNIKPDVIARQRGLAVVGVNGFNPDWSRLPPAESQRIANTVMKTPVGQVSTIKVGNEYILAKPSKNSQQEVPPLSQMKDLVVRTLKLSKAPSRAVKMKELYEGGHIVFENDKYKYFFAELDNIPSATEAPKNK